MPSPRSAAWATHGANRAPYQAVNWVIMVNAELIPRRPGLLFVNLCRIEQPIAIHQRHGALAANGDGAIEA